MNANNTNSDHLLHRSATVPFSRRALLSGIVMTPAIATFLAACGDNTKVADPASRSTPDSSTPQTDLPTITETPPATDGSTAETVVVHGIVHPSLPGDVVLRLGFLGGLLPAGYAFTSVPTILLTGDGRVITPGAVTDIYPGPLLPALNVRTITEAGIQTILEAADKAGLLQTPPDYSADLTVADAPDTKLEIHANELAFVHQAPALGFDEPAATKARQALNDFCMSLGDITKLVGAENLGEEHALEPTSYRMIAEPVLAPDATASPATTSPATTSPATTSPATIGVATTGVATTEQGLAPTYIAWPSTLGVSLAAATTCVEVSAVKIGTLFSDANQLTYFTENGSSYMVSAVAVLPGDIC